MNDFLGFPIPIYCERGSLGFFEEPLNAISNIALIFAGLGIYKLLIKNKIQEVEYKALLILVFIIGVGSFLWHVTRNVYALILDAAPVALTFALITYILLSKLIKQKLIALSIALMLIPTRFFISSFAPTDISGSLIRNLINTTSFLLIILWTIRKYGRVAFDGLTVLTVYLVAITARSLDLQVCPTFYIGTHFLWHILNALAIYLAVRLIIKLEKV